MWRISLPFYSLDGEITGAPGRPAARAVDWRREKERGVEIRPKRKKCRSEQRRTTEEEREREDEGRERARQPLSGRRAKMSRMERKARTSSRPPRGGLDRSRI